jgi:hypothetical protein
MSTITKEFTKEQLQQIIETDHVQCGEASALARIALASLEAEAVCYLTWHQGFRAPDDCRNTLLKLSRVTSPAMVHLRFQCMPHRQRQCPMKIRCWQNKQEQ